MWVAPGEHSSADAVLTTILGSGRMLALLKLEEQVARRTPALFKVSSPRSMKEMMRRTVTIGAVAAVLFLAGGLAYQTSQKDSTTASTETVEGTFALAPAQPMSEQRAAILGNPDAQTYGSTVVRLQQQDSSTQWSNTHELIGTTSGSNESPAIRKPGTNQKSFTNSAVTGDSSITVQLPELEPGKYRLLREVVDEGTQRTTYGSAEFSIS